MDSVLDFLENERYFPEQSEETLQIPWLYVTPWGFLPFGFLHLRMQMPHAAKLVLRCVMILYLAHIYPQRRCEAIFIRDMRNLFKEWPWYRNSLRRINRTGSYSVRRNAILAISVIALRLLIFEKGLFSERLSPRFLETVRHRTTGFAKGLDCLSAYSRKDERDFLLYEALNCSKFTYRRGHGILRYVPAVQSVQTLKLRCLYPTGPVMEGSVSVRPARAQDVPNGIRLSTNWLVHDCRSVGLNCSNVLRLKYLPGRMNVLLSRPRKEIVIHVRSDTVPNSVVIQETLRAFQKGVKLKNMTRIALGAAATFKFGPCFRLGRTVETSPPVRLSCLCVNVWSLAVFAVLELFFAKALAMRSNEDWGPEEGIEIAVEGVEAFEMFEP